MLRMPDWAAGPDMTDVALAGSPESLAAAHVGWAADVAALGPWTLWAEDESGWVAASEESVTICPACSSAFDVGWKLHAAGRLKDWESIVCARQWAGRGQMRRAWDSPVGNLFAVVAWPAPDEGLSPLLPLIVGAAVAEGLGPQVKLKWPNDLLADGRKVGGVLIEERVSERGSRVLAGVGLNVVHAPDPSLLRADRAVNATSLREVPGFEAFAEGAKGPLQLWLQLVNAARRWYATFIAGSTPGEVASRVERRLAWMGERVRLPGGWSDLGESGDVSCGSPYESPPGDLVGIVAGVAPDGALRLRDVEGPHGAPGVRGGPRERLLYSGSILPY